MKTHDSFVVVFSFPFFFVLGRFFPQLVIKESGAITMVTRQFLIIDKNATFILGFSFLIILNYKKIINSLL